MQYTSLLDLWMVGAAQEEMTSKAIDLRRQTTDLNHDPCALGEIVMRFAWNVRGHTLEVFKAGLHVQSCLVCGVRCAFRRVIRQMPHQKTTQCSTLSTR